MGKILEIRPQFVSVKEAVKASGMSEHFIRDNLKSGKIKHIRAGRTYRINLPRLLEWLDTQSSGGDGDEV